MQTVSVDAKEFLRDRFASLRKQQREEGSKVLKAYPTRREGELAAFPRRRAQAGGAPSQLGSQG